MKYVCMEDIELLAAQGKKELILDEKTVLMDLARDMAHQLGIEIVSGFATTPVKAVSPAASSAPTTPVPVSVGKAASAVTPVPSAREALPKQAAKPKGCQHGPLAAPARQERSIKRQDSDGVVDQLVELVRQSSGKRSEN